MSRSLSRLNRFHRQIGATLLEILAVLAVLGVMMSIGFPAYQSIIQDKRHLQGETMLLDLLQRQEQYYSSNDSYTITPADINYDPSKASSDNKIYYTIEAEPCAGRQISQCVHLIASPILPGDSYLSVSSVSDTLVVSDTKP